MYWASTGMSSVVDVLCVKLIKLEICFHSWAQAVHREVWRINAYIKGKKVSDKQPTFVPQGIEEQTKPKVSRRKELTSIRAKLSEIEMIETTVKITKTEFLRS